MRIPVILTSIIYIIYYISKLIFVLFIFRQRETLWVIHFAIYFTIRHASYFVYFLTFKYI